MRTILEAGPEKRAPKEKCRHYWIIESPNGPTSGGLCKYCGARKEFENSVAYSLREDDIAMLIEPSRWMDFESGNNPGDS